MIDRIRELYPHLAIGVYALEPKGPVTVEVFAPDGTRFSKTAATEAECIYAIFGSLPDEEPEPPAEIAPVDPFS